MARDLPSREEQVKRAFDAWNKGDHAGWLADVHPDFEYAPGIVVGPSEGERVVYRGEKLQAFFEEWHSQWRMEITVSYVEELADGRVLVLGRARLTGVQSGATFEQDVGWVGQVEGDQLRRLDSYPSHEAAREAVAG